MNHTTIINGLVEAMGNPRYLEIGYGAGGNFRKIGAHRKLAVDPHWHLKSIHGPQFAGASDDFFRLPLRKVDLIFIDGLHEQAQFHRDVCNALQVLSADGIIVCHDVSPRTELEQRVPRQSEMWTGDVWKSWVRLRHQRDDLEMFVFDCDFGVGIIRRRRPEVRLETLPEALTFDVLKQQRERLLNLVPAAGFAEWLKRLKFETLSAPAEARKVVVFERTRIEWPHANQSMFLNQAALGLSKWERGDKGKIAKIKRGVKFWNDAFGIGFFEYRARINQLAEQSWAAMGKDVTLVRDIEILESLAEVKDFWILPTDDDDWFAPGLPRMLEFLDLERYDALSWPQLRYCPGWSHDEAQRGAANKLWVSKRRFESNGYALSSRILKSRGSGYFRKVVGQHMFGLRERIAGSLRVLDLDPCFSAKHHSPGSIMNLQGFHHGRLADIAEKVARPLPQVPMDCRWASALLQAAELINRELVEPIAIADRAAPVSLERGLSARR